jgi:hypothetical protein
MFLLFRKVSKENAAMDILLQLRHICRNYAKKKSCIKQAM